jgi:hypothetical protein
LNRLSCRVLSCPVCDWEEGEQVWRGLLHQQPVWCCSGGWGGSHGRVWAARSWCKGTFGRGCNGHLDWVQRKVRGYNRGAHFGRYFAAPHGHSVTRRRGCWRMARLGRRGLPRGVRLSLGCCSGKFYLRRSRLRSSSGYPMILPSNRLLLRTTYPHWFLIGNTCDGGVAFEWSVGVCYDANPQTPLCELRSQNT